MTDCNLFAQSLLQIGFIQLIIGSIFYAIFFKWHKNKYKPQAFKVLKKAKDVGMIDIDLEKLKEDKK
jgi:hypothetical protein